MPRHTRPPERRPDPAWLARRAEADERRKRTARLVRNREAHHRTASEIRELEYERDASIAVLRDPWATDAERRTARRLLAVLRRHERTEEPTDAG